MNGRVRDIARSAYESALLTLGIILSLSLVHAEVMQSTSYRIQSDSVNIGGGLASSTSYALESTVGEVATGESGSASYNLKAGYQQMVNAFIALSGGANVTMAPAIGGVSGGTANGSTTVTVITDSAGGYLLSVKAESTPTLTKGADDINDYVPGGVPDFTFTTDPTDAHLGYSPSGEDVVARFQDDGGACGVGSLETPLACWDGLSTSNTPIEQGGGANMPLGATTTIYFRVGIGGNVLQAPGTYIGTTTITAVAL